ncbi:MAG: lactonase family protein [Planctomycetaceae bacterium]
MFRLSHVISLTTGIILMLIAHPSFSATPTVLVSSFAPGDQGGIQAYQLNTESGAITPLHRTGGIPNAFFIAISPDQKFLYSIDAKTFGGSEPEQVAAFRLESGNGQLKLINRQTTRGTASCFLEVDQTGKSLLVANYSSGNVASYAVQPDGSLSAPVSFFQHTGSSCNLARQKEAHAHCFVISPNNKYAYAADLGIDQILCYVIDPATATLTPNTQPFVRTLAGAGPRHLTFHPNGKCLYVINELANSITRYDYAAETGMLIERQTISTIPESFAGVTHTADLKITPNGKFLYGTNRGHDSVACYQIAEDGQLSLIEIVPSLGQGPQNLAITADGNLLLCANMPGNNLAIFRIGMDGKLKSVGTPTEITGPSCIRILK